MPTKKFTEGLVERYSVKGRVERAHGLFCVKPHISKTDVSLRSESGRDAAAHGTIDMAVLPRRACDAIQGRFLIPREHPFVLSDCRLLLRLLPAFFLLPVTNPTANTFLLRGER